MINIEKTEVFGWDAAIRGMRNPMNSWDKSDSVWSNGYIDEDHVTVQYAGDYDEYQLGKNDRDLMMRLARGGAVHAKYRRMIVVTCDITAPLYWWKEFDTYKVGTVANSCSTMHKIHDKEFTLDDFSHEHLWGKAKVLLEDYIIPTLNDDRECFLESNEKDDWWQMIQLLPCTSPSFG